MKLIKKLKKVFPKKQQRMFVLVFVLGLIGTGLDFFGVSMILPVVNLMVTPERILGSRWYQYLDGIFHFPSLQSAMLALIIAVIVLYVVKNLYSIFLGVFQSAYIAKNRFDTSARLLNCYMHKPYTFHLQHNTSEVIRSINTDTNNAFTVVFSLISLISSVLLTLLLVVYLFRVDAVFTLAVVVGLAICSAVYFLLVRRGIQTTGQEARHLVMVMYKAVLQAIGGIKAVKIMGREQYFVDTYRENSDAVIRNGIKSQLFAGIPNRLIEMLCVSGLLGVVAVRVARGTDLAALVPGLSAFAVAAIKLMPNASSINSAINSITFNMPALDAICETIDEHFINVNAQLEGFSRPEHVARSSQDITVENVWFTYPNMPDPVLTGVNLTIPHGTSVGIVGVTGAGKTTLVDIILGLLEPQQGTVRYGGQDIREDYSAWQSRIGYIPQDIYLTDESIRANVALGMFQQDVDDDRVWDCLEKAQLADFVRGLKDGLDTRVGERGVRLSGGQRQRIGIARALYNDPDVLFFDEATSSLDNATEKAVMASINQISKERTTIIIAHRLTTIEQCDRIYKVEDGTLKETTI